MGCLCSKDDSVDSEPLLKGEKNESVKSLSNTNSNTPLGVDSPYKYSPMKDDFHSNNSLSPTPTRIRSLAATGAGTNNHTSVALNATDLKLPTAVLENNASLTPKNNNSEERGSATSSLNNFVNTLSNKGTFVFNSKHAFKKVQKHKKGTTRFTLHKQLQSILSSGNMEMYEIVKLPEGQNMNEWLCVHVVDFFNEVCLLYGCIVDECTEQHCPNMTAGRCTYLWADGKAVKKPQKVPAKQYVDYLMTWIEEQISNESLFSISNESPVLTATSIGSAQTPTSPVEVSSDIKSIFKRLFRVYGHMYHKHFPDFEHIKAESHLNTCFERYIYFSLEFNLIEEKELEPMKELIDMFKLKRDNKINEH